MSLTKSRKSLRLRLYHAYSMSRLQNRNADLNKITLPAQKQLLCCLLRLEIAVKLGQVAHYPRKPQWVTEVHQVLLAMLISKFRNARVPLQESIPPPRTVPSRRSRKEQDGCQCMSVYHQTFTQANTHKTAPSATVSTPSGLFPPSKSRGRSRFKAHSIRTVAMNSDSLARSLPTQIRRPEPNVTCPA